MEKNMSDDKKSLLVSELSEDDMEAIKRSMHPDNYTMYNGAMDQLEFLTQDTTVISHRVNQWFCILKNREGEVVGFQLWHPLEFAKELDKRPKQLALTGNENISKEKKDR